MKKQGRREKGRWNQTGTSPRLPLSTFPALVDVLIPKHTRDLLLRVHTAVHFDVGIDEEVECRTLLAWFEVDVATGRELNAVLGQIAEVVILHLRKSVG